MTIRFKFTLPVNISRGICCWSDLLQRVEECRHVEPASMDSTVQHLGALARNYARVVRIDEKNKDELGNGSSKGEVAFFLV